MYKWMMPAFILALVFGTACTPRSEDQACVIVAANPRTGPQAAIGREIDRAIKIARAELGANSGIRIEEVDTESAPTVARAKLEKAIKQPKAPVVVGSILSAETREFLEEMLRQGVVVLANGSSDPAIRDLPYRRAGDGFFRNWPADDFEGRVMAEYLISTNRAKRLVVMHANDPYAGSLASSFMVRFRELGGEVLGPEVYGTEMTSFDELVLRQPRQGHDGYYVIGFPTDLAGIYNTLRASEETKATPIYSAVGINTSEFVSLVNGALDKLFFTSPAVDEAAGPYFKFRQTYQEHFGAENPDIVAAVTYDALKIAISSIKQVGCDGKAIRDYLYKAPPYNGASGPTGFDSLGDVVTKGVAINYYENGRRLQAEVRFAGN